MYFLNASQIIIELKGLIKLFFQIFLFLRGLLVLDGKKIKVSTSYIRLYIYNLKAYSLFHIYFNAVTIITLCFGFLCQFLVIQILEFSWIFSYVLSMHTIWWFDWICFFTSFALFQYCLRFNCVELKYHVNFQSCNSARDCNSNGVSNFSFHFKQHALNNSVNSLEI